MNWKRPSIWPGSIPTLKDRINSLGSIVKQLLDHFMTEYVFNLFFVYKLKVINDQYASHSSGKTVTIKA